MAVHRRFEVTDLTELWSVETPAVGDLRPVVTLGQIATISNSDLVECLAHQVTG
jgi:hypothetical protein